MSFDIGSSPAFSEWLAQRVGADSVSIIDTITPSGGFSAETVVLTALCRRGAEESTEKVVARLETPDPAVYPRQSATELLEIEIQYRVMDAISKHSDVPVAPLLGFESDAAIIGTPFFVMGCVDGEVPRESPPYTTEGFFVDASPGIRRSMVTTGLDAMAQIHRIDWEAADLGWLEHEGLTPGTPTQLERWSTFAATELRGRAHPVLEEAVAWLEQNLPADSDTVLCWGDPRPGNIIYQDGRPACLTDFEAAYLGSPMMDLAWWLMFDRTMHEFAAPAGVPFQRLEGDPDRDEQRSIYFELSGRPVEDTSAHEVFAAMRYCAIVTRVMNRLEERGQIPADNLIWRDNPATTCLVALLDDFR